MTKLGIVFTADRAPEELAVMEADQASREGTDLDTPADPGGA